MKTHSDIKLHPRCPHWTFLGRLADELALALGRSIDPSHLLAEVVWVPTTDGPLPLFDDLVPAPSRRNTGGVSRRSRILRAFGQTCLYCERRGTEHRDPDGNRWNIDHFIPIVRGGSNHPANLVLACRSCNYSKRDRLWSPGQRRGYMGQRHVSPALPFDLASWSSATATGTVRGRSR